MSADPLLTFRPTGGSIGIVATPCCPERQDSTLLTKCAFRKKWPTVIRDSHFAQPRGHWAYKAARARTARELIPGQASWVFYRLGARLCLFIARAAGERLVRRRPCPRGSGARCARVAAACWQWRSGWPSPSAVGRPASHRLLMGTGERHCLSVARPERGSVR